MSWIDSLGTFLTYQLEATDHLGQHILHNTQFSNPFPSLNLFQGTPGPRASFQTSVCLFSIYFFQWFLLSFRERVKQKSHQDKVKVKSLSPTLCDPMDCSLPRSSVHGIFLARVLEWAAISFSRGSSRPQNRTQGFSIADGRFTDWLFFDWLMVSGLSSALQGTVKGRGRGNLISTEILLHIELLGIISSFI